MASDGSRLTKLEGLVRSLGARLASSVGAVSSVFGRTGAVVAATNDYTWAQINKATSSLADITTRAESALTTTDITTNDVSSTKHGFAPKSPANAAQFLNGAATPAFAAVKDSDLSTSDITTNNSSSTKHGFAVKSPADATQFLNGAATPAYAAVKDSDLSTSDITTNDATTLKHGFLLKLGGGTTNFLRADGTWAAPGGGATLSDVQTAVSTTLFQTTSTTYTDVTTMTVTTTRAGTGDKVFVWCGITWSNETASETITQRIVWGGTPTEFGTVMQVRSGTAGNEYGACCTFGYETGAAAGATTYKAQVKNSTAANTITGVVANSGNRYIMLQRWT